MMWDIKTVLQKLICLHH